MFMVNLRSGQRDPRFFLGVLNSRLVRALWLDQYYDRRRTFPKIKGTYLKAIPVPVNSLDPEKATRLVALVEEMLRMTQQADQQRTDHGYNVVDRQITALDDQIDQLVYELYGLTAEEIRIVEEATA